VVTTVSRSLRTATSAGRVASVFWRDRAFYAALCAGPVCWFILVAIQLPIIGPPGLVLLLKLSLLMPVLEEIVFRGGVQAALYQRPLFVKHWVGISLANVITSLLFASMHLISQPPLWAALVFVPSLIFGWARDRYEAVLPCVLLHSLYNAGFVWLFVTSA